jgi:hypothetical protein
VELDDGDSAPVQRLDDVLDFRCGQGEVPVDRGPAAAQGLEVDDGGEAELGQQDVAVAVDDGVLPGSVKLYKLTPRQYVAELGCAH